MAWSAPITAVAHTAFASADFNTYVRNNLLETEPGRATSSYGNGSLPVKTATNQITFRTPAQSEVTSSQGVSQTSYTDLSTAGPTVTVTTGVNAFVSWHCSMANSGAGNGYMSVQITPSGGAVTHSASDTYALRHEDNTGSSGEQMIGMSYLFTDLTAGLNSFQAKYRTSSGTETFRYRRLSVIPF